MLWMLLIAIAAQPSASATCESRRNPNPTRSPLVEKLATELWEKGDLAVLRARLSEQAEKGATPEDRDVAKGRLTYLGRFEQALADAEAAWKAEDWKRASRGYMDAAMYGSGFSEGGQTKRVSARVLEALHREAKAFQDAGDHRDAAYHWKKLLERSPGHPGAEAGLRRLRGRAEDAFYEALGLKEGSQRQYMRFTDVAALTLPGDPLHQKATARMEAHLKRQAEERAAREKAPAASGR